MACIVRPVQAMLLKLTVAPSNRCISFQFITMSGRGRGRGGRGGRGGATGMHPVAKDDEGKILRKEVPEGPPPIFPEVELPDVPTEIPTITERQLMRRHELTSFWKSSPFYLRPPRSTSGSKTAGDVERYADQFKQKARSDHPPLTSILTLDPRYFPEELFSSKQQMAAKSAAAQQAYWAAQQAWRAATPAAGGEDFALGKLEELAKRESRQRVGGAGAEAAGPERPEGEGEEAPAGAEQEEEEDFPEDDDYYQNEYFDDDEGYDDGLDDGGDEGPIY